MSYSIRVAVTGISGHLGSHLAPLLAEDGFEVVGLDVASPRQPLPDRSRFTLTDLCDEDAVRNTLAGADLVVHCASVHPWKPYSDSQYLDCNVKGTWVLYTAAASLGINRIVLTSSIAAVGYGVGAAWPVTEDVESPLGDLYGYTKHAQEDIARVFADAGKVRTLALRPPAFMPRAELETGFSLTGPCAVVEDVAGAHLEAVRVLSGRKPAGAEMAPFEAVFVTNQLPYGPDDAALMATEGSAKPLVRRHWPEAYEWLIARGYEGTWVPAAYDLSKARRLLGWSPKRNFEQWFAEAKGKLQAPIPPAGSAHRPAAAEPVRHR